MASAIDITIGCTLGKSGLDISLTKTGMQTIGFTLCKLGSHIEELLSYLQ